MPRKAAYRPSLIDLESRLLPTADPYADAMRNAIQAAYVAEAPKANGVVFLGDSITQFWGTTGVAPIGTFSADFGKLGAVNFGIAGDTTADVLYRIQGGDLDGQPKVVVLLVGVNDLFQGKTAAQAAAGVDADVQAIHAASPESKVLLLGLLPNDIPTINPLIPEVNALISGLAAEPYVTYQDPGTLLEQANGMAQPSLLRDTVHPDATGYQVIAGAIDGTLTGLLDGGAATTGKPSAASPTTGAALPAAPPTPSPSALIPPIEGGPDASTDTPPDPTESSSHPRSFATELFDASSS